MNLHDAMEKERSQPNSSRVESIVKRARQEVAAKDLVEFGGAKIWLAFLSILNALAALFARRPTDASGGAPAGKNSSDQERTP